MDYIYYYVSFGILTGSFVVFALPSIRPVPCTNPLTGESGICTFHWSCVNVAHGVHIGPCVDRFFVGTCCKIQSGLSTSNNGEIQTEGKVSAAYTPLHSTLAKETEKEKVKKPISIINIDHFNVTLSPSKYHDHRTTLSETYKPHSSKLDNKLKTPQETGYLSPRRPILSASFFHNFFFSNHNVYEANEGLHQEQIARTTSAYSLQSKDSTSIPINQKPSTTSDLWYQNQSPRIDNEKRSTISGLWNQNQSPQSAHNQRVPVAVESSHDLRRPVIVHQSHDQRNPIRPNEQHDLRRPVPLDEAHDLRWPILEEDLHDQRLPVVNLFEWAGNVYLNNHQKPGVSNSFYSLSGEKIQTSTSDVSSTDFKFITEPSPTSASTMEKTTTAPVSTIASSSINTAPNFTLFVQPTSYQSPPFSSTTKPTSIQGSALRNVSQVCGRSRVGTMARIVGGRKSHYLRWPWMISLRRFEEKSYKHKCGATLLNEYWAMTAAHCVDGKLPMEVILRLGEYNFRRADELHPHVERRVYVMVIHPQFDHITYENDLALLRFNEPVRLQANIAPVCLPNATDDFTGRIAVVTGWGRLSEGELPASLHEVHMPILSNKECQQLYSEAGFAEDIKEVFVCAGLFNGGLDACEGDSGGPMVVQGDEGQWILAGLISWGMGCAAPKQPGVYTRISHFTDWIGRIISH